MTGPVAEAGWYDINGFQQWIAMRGDDARNPVLLWLHGGPGMAMTPAIPLFREWERDFTVVMWDQPGSGATGVRYLYDAQHKADPGELSLDRIAKDGIAVAELLRKKFGKRKIALMGISWGTQLGVEMAHRRPDLFSVYVGTAQVTGPRGIKLGYEIALQQQREKGNAAGVAALEGIGPPPWSSWDKLLIRQQFTNPPGQPPSPAEAARTAEMTAYLAANPLDPKYQGYPMPPEGFVPARDGVMMFLNTVQTVMMRESKWEIRDLGRDWPMPIFVFQGELDLNAPEPLAREWVEEIRAPKKGYAVISGAAHNTIAFHADLLALMRQHGVSEIARARG
jgi:pimeloyl-ACP methyl ester carboxylesterase